jgi:hypothetical protein
MKEYINLIKVNQKSSFSFFFISFIFFFGCGILILLIFWDQVVHIGFSFSEFHFIHTFTSVPVEESLSSKHGSELFSNTLEHFLDGSGVTKEGNSHFESLGGNITNGRFNVVGNPFDEVRRVLVLNVQHLFINFFGRHSSSKEGRGS